MKKHSIATAFKSFKLFFIPREELYKYQLQYVVTALLTERTRLSSPPTNTVTEESETPAAASGVPALLVLNGQQC